MKKNLLILLSFLAFFCQADFVQAQSQRKVVQFTGLVVSGDSAYGVPGVYIYVPAAGRGTASNYLGYFSLATLVGDSVVIKAIGFKEKKFIIPDTDQDKVSVIIEMLEDTTYLPTVDVFPWPTEKIFKEAFLALKLPEQEIENMNTNINERVIQRMMGNVSNDGSLNYKNYMQQQLQTSDNRYYLPTLNLLNPFAWGKFIDQVKKGGLKQNEGKEYNDEEE